MLYSRGRHVSRASLVGRPAGLELVAAALFNALGPQLSATLTTRHAPPRPGRRYALSSPWTASLLYFAPHFISRQGIGFHDGSRPTRKEKKEAEGEEEKLEVS